MQLNNVQFNDLVKNIPAIELELVWAGNQGIKKVEDYEIYSGEFILFFDCFVYQSRTLSKGDYLTPSSYCKNRVEVDFFTIDIFVNDLCEKVKLKPDQIEKVKSEITKSIYTR